MNALAVPAPSVRRLGGRPEHLAGRVADGHRVARAVDPDHGQGRMRQRHLEVRRPERNGDRVGVAVGAGDGAARRVVLSTCRSGVTPKPSAARTRASARDCAFGRSFAQFLRADERDRGVEVDVAVADLPERERAAVGRVDRGGRRLERGPDLVRASATGWPGGGRPRRRRCAARPCSCRTRRPGRSRAAGTAR